MELLQGLLAQDTPQERQALTQKYRDQGSTSGSPVGTPQGPPLQSTRGGCPCRAWRDDACGTSVPGPGAPRGLFPWSPPPRQPPSLDREDPSTRGAPMTSLGQLASDDFGLTSLGLDFCLRSTSRDGGTKSASSWGESGFHPLAYGRLLLSKMQNPASALGAGARVLTAVYS